MVLTGPLERRGAGTPGEAGAWRGPRRIGGDRDMLGRKSYTQDEIDTARSAVTALLTAHDDLAKTIDGEAAQAALEAFEPLFFNTMVLVLDRPFVHRLRGSTGKDGNALNEVELICDSLMNNGAVLRGNNVITYVPEQSVVQLQVGAPIRLTAEQFERLSTAFFAELESRFLQP
jgi:hypothetical protein